MKIFWRKGMKKYDLIAIGTGSAMNIVETQLQMEPDLKIAVIDKDEPGGTVRHYPRRKLVMTQQADIPLYGRLKRSEYSKEDLLDIWMDIVKRFSLDIRSGEPVEAVTRNGNGFYVRTPGSEYNARCVVLALGRRGTPRTLGVPGEDLSKVVYQMALEVKDRR